MRTTVTLDDDLVAAVQGLARERRLSFKDALNLIVRAGLRPSDGGPVPLPAGRPMRLRPGIDLDKALRLADELEDDEIVRKLEIRK